MHLAEHIVQSYNIGKSLVFSPAVGKLHTFKNPLPYHQYCGAVVKKFVCSRPVLALILL